MINLYFTKKKYHHGGRILRAATKIIQFPPHKVPSKDDILECWKCKEVSFISSEFRYTHRHYLLFYVYPSFHH